MCVYYAKYVWLITDYLYKNEGSKIDDAKRTRIIAARRRDLQIAKWQYAPTTDFL